MNEILENKYLKYKNKYLSLQILQNGGKNIKYELFKKIKNIDDNSIEINEIVGNKKNDKCLLIISGFSLSSYDKNYNTLFEYYTHKIDKSLFKKIYIIKFKDDDEFSIAKLHSSFFDSSNNILDPKLENNLYKKLASIIKSKLKIKKKLTILAKSAGGGVGIYLSNMIYKKVNKLLLFAPGLGFIDKDTKFILKLDEDKILIGWNNEDTKVKYDNVYPKLKLKLPNTQVKLFNKDIHSDIDTQHEINSKFIEFIY
jgi:hypothetical protein